MCSGGNKKDEDDGNPLAVVTKKIVSTPQEIVEDVEDEWKKTDLAKAGGVLVDAADSVISGKPKGVFADTADQFEEDSEKIKESWSEAGENLQDSADAIGEAVMTGFGVAEQFSENYKKKFGPKDLPNDDQFNAMASMEGDPRLASLMARMRRRRKQGKSQLRKGGGLYIPLKAGIQVQT